LKVKLTPQNNVFKPTGPFIHTTWKILFSKLKMITQPLNSAIKQEHKTYKLTIVKKKDKSLGSNNNQEPKGSQGYCVYSSYTCINFETLPMREGIKWLSNTLHTQ